MNDNQQVLQVLDFDGGSVVTDLGYNIRLNSESSLHRKWVVVNDPDCPIQFKVAGINTSYIDQEYLFTQSGRLSCTASVAALELRYILYDMFGRHLKTLSSVTVRDILPDRFAELSELGRWRGWENEVSSLHTVVAFVAYVRTGEGRIWRHKEKPLSDELARIELTANSEILSPVKEK